MPGRNLKYRLSLILSILGTSILIDQTTKIISERYIPSRTPIVWLWGTIRLQHVKNAGAMLGMGSGLSEGARFLVFVILVSLALSALFFYTLWNRRLRTEYIIAVSLILGGGLSNLIDRLMFHGVVRDFMNVGIGVVRTGIFNVADMLILSGLALILFAEFRRHRTGQEPSDHKQDTDPL
ncbi:MAG: signal peptidase II [Candidatus Eisenbacteria bacterium]|uniref:Lipoprotein signal peptidase n=1 Tax=Eiseniibacteriota bacterium TaxID=2212470 RepID=A0A948RVP1_UNCEI|nr:signal peptidase II [Candidatus Eisenbacteria bacterium]MBU2691725.1 signal peptidase II [Candidatus Eisenbacteria bacterium]